MVIYLAAENFRSQSSDTTELLKKDLKLILEEDVTDNLYKTLAHYKRILSDNKRHHLWPDIHKKLATIFKCGRCTPLDGPMVGVSMGIRDSDYFRDTARQFGLERSHIAGIEWMSTAWNMSFAYSGLWMGKTFEPVTKETVEEKCGGATQVMQKYDQCTTRLGRNFFRNPPDPSLLQIISLPSLSLLWNLKDRPLATSCDDFDSTLTQNNLEKEHKIPFQKTGGYFLADLGTSVLPEMESKPVYQLNYRWPRLVPVYPMTRLVDELVQIAEGIYLGQLIYATRHFSLGTITSRLGISLPELSIGEPYNPETNEASSPSYYQYQNNGYFLMLDPNYSDQIYSRESFYEIRPRPGEIGYTMQSSLKQASPIAQTEKQSWQKDSTLRHKFTTFLLEPSPRPDDQDISRELNKGESILQMLQRISSDISKQSRHEDILQHFEKLNMLFRRGIAPKIKIGLFTGSGEKPFNHSLTVTPTTWYGHPEPTFGVDFYHGANLNLHCGFQDTFQPNIKKHVDDCQLLPDLLAEKLSTAASPTHNLLDTTWHAIGKYIFPWAGKSFQQISGRKLSMLLDESNDLAERYPERVGELSRSPASATHYDLIQKNRHNFWKTPGAFHSHLQTNSWDNGMSSNDKSFWQKEAKNNWVYGTNLMDERILTFDGLMKLVDTNYQPLDPVIQQASEKGPSPFCRQGYIFLGTDDRESILPMNNGPEQKKKVFQFHYRYPMIGGPIPIGFCLDELVEIASGLFLGQLIYSTALDTPFHSSVHSSNYKYQLFGYFLLLDDQWQKHRLSIGLDIWRKEEN
ncbi:MAG: hypothetical protein ACI8ZB_004178 [Desulforhopalus sp.]|jgi:hypothetical protein